MRRQVSHHRWSSWRFQWRSSRHSLRDFVSCVYVLSYLVTATCVFITCKYYTRLTICGCVCATDLLRWPFAWLADASASLFPSCRDYLRVRLNLRVRDNFGVGIHVLRDMLKCSILENLHENTLSFNLGGKFTSGQSNIREWNCFLIFFPEDMPGPS